MAYRVLEAAVERRAITLIKRRWPKVEHRKMNGYGFNSWPDRLFLFEENISIWIEFKRPGEETSKGQDHIHAILKALGCHVVTCDNAEQAVVFCEAIIENEREKRKSKKV